MPKEIEIVVRDDGTIMIPYEAKQYQDTLLKLIDGLIPQSEKERILHFFAANETELVYGDSVMCG